MYSKNDELKNELFNDGCITDGYVNESFVVVNFHIQIHYTVKRLMN